MSEQDTDRLLLSVCRHFCLSVAHTAADLGRKPGSFDYPPAADPPSVTLQQLRDSWDSWTDLERLQAIRHSLRRERQARVAARATADATRRSTNISMPPAMPSESDTPARRMRNILRQVGPDGSRRPHSNLRNLDPRPHNRTAARSHSTTPESDEAESDALGHAEQGGGNHYPPNWSRSMYPARARRRSGAVQTSITGVPSWALHRADYTRSRSSSSQADAQNGRWDAHAASERVDRENQQLRHLLQLPIPSSSLRRRRSDDDVDGGAGRHKRCRFEDEAPSKAYYPITYGHEGQEVAGKLKMQLVSTDGGIVDSSDPLWDRTCSQDKYAAANVLRDDMSVYCTLSSHCNMVFQHRGQTPFTLQKLIIKGPMTGYTDPVQEGLVFTSLHQDAIFEATKRYQVHHYPTSRFGDFFQPAAATGERGQAPLGRRMTRSTPPPYDEGGLFSGAHVQQDSESDDEQSTLSDSTSAAGSEEGVPMGDAEDEDNEYDFERESDDFFPSDFLGHSTGLAGQVLAGDHDREDSSNNADSYARQIAAQRQRTMDSLRAMRRANHPNHPGHPRVQHNFNHHRAATPPEIAHIAEDSEQTRRVNDSGHENRAASGASGYCIMNQPDDHSAPLYLLMPEARFSMQSKRSSSCGPGHSRKRHLTRWYTRVEARVHTQVNLGRPRNLAVVDEQGPRPTTKLGSVLRTERTEHGGLVDFTHVRTTQTVQKDNTMTISFDPPVSARFILLKLWNPEATGEAQEKRNIDIQSIQTIGWAGPRWFPAVDMR